MRRTVTLLLFVFFLVGLPAALKTQPPSSTPQQQQTKEQTVYVTKTGKKYHISTCRYLANSKIPMSLKEAKEKGFTACLICKPPK
jgi:hypothetical protein